MPNIGNIKAGSGLDMSMARGTYSGPISVGSRDDDPSTYENRGFVGMTEEEYRVLEECSIDRETTLSETIRYAIRNLAKRLGVKNAKDK